MDSEENRELQHALRTGKPETDEGPYYHNSWWEGYKGGVKGLLGGLLIGAGVGALVGLPVAGILAGMEVAGLTTAAIPTIVAAFSAAGMLVGAHEFVTLGMVVGSDAASQEKAEQRNKVELSRAVGEIKAELAEIKALVKGKPEILAEAEKKAAKKAIPDEPDAGRSTHCDEHCPPTKMKLIFWKVAAIGAAVGAAAGALLVGGGLDAHILHFLGHQAAEQIAGSGAAMTAATVTGALAGASFGINRDVFRQVFDTTDHWFRGVLVNGKHKESHVVQQHIAPEAPCAGLAEAPEPDQRPRTYFRDKVLASAKLSEIDPNTAIRH